MKKSRSLINIIIVVTSLFAVVMFLCTPIISLKYQGETTTVLGFTATFGGTFERASGVEGVRTLQFNWACYLVILGLLFTSATVFIVNNKKRWFYIIAGLILAIIAVLCFTMKTTWLQSTFQEATGRINSGSLGVGPWVCGLCSVATSLMCFYEYYAAKLA